MKKIVFIIAEKCFLVYEESQKLIAHEYNWALMGGVVESEIPFSLYEKIKLEKTNGNTSSTLAQHRKDNAKVLHAKFEMPYSELSEGDEWSLEKQAEYYIGLQTMQIKNLIFKGKATEKQECLLEKYVSVIESRDQAGIVQLFNEIGVAKK